MNVDRYGNTSAASVAIALDEAVRSGRVAIGDKLVLRRVRGRLHERRRGAHLDRRSGQFGALPGRRGGGQRARARLVGCVDPMPPRLAAVLADPKGRPSPLDDVVPGEPEQRTEAAR